MSETAKDVYKRQLLECSDLLSEMKRALAGLADVTAKAAAVQGTKECAYAYHDLVVPGMEALRRPADRLEMLVDKELWPMPSYGDLICEV